MGGIVSLITGVDSTEYVGSAGGGIEAGCVRASDTTNAGDGGPKEGGAEAGNCAAGTGVDPTPRLKDVVVRTYSLLARLDPQCLGKASEIVYQKPHVRFHLEKQKNRMTVAKWRLGLKVCEVDVGPTDKVMSPAFVKKVAAAGKFEGPFAVALRSGTSLLTPLERFERDCRKYPDLTRALVFGNLENKTINTTTGVYKYISNLTKALAGLGTKLTSADVEARCNLPSPKKAGLVAPVEDVPEGENNYKELWKSIKEGTVYPSTWLMKVAGTMAVPKGTDTLGEDFVKTIPHPNFKNMLRTAKTDTSAAKTRNKEIRPDGSYKQYTPNRNCSLGFSHPKENFSKQYTKHLAVCQCCRDFAAGIYKLEKAVDGPYPKPEAIVGCAAKALAKNQELDFGDVGTFNEADFKQRLQAKKRKEFSPKKKSPPRLKKKGKGRKDNKPTAPVRIDLDGAGAGGP